MNGSGSQGSRRGEAKRGKNFFFKTRVGIKSCQATFSICSHALSQRCFKIQRLNSQNHAASVSPEQGKGSAPKTYNIQYFTVHPTT